MAWFYQPDKARVLLSLLRSSVASKQPTDDDGPSPLAAPASHAVSDGLDSARQSRTRNRPSSSQTAPEDSPQEGGNLAAPDTGAGERERRNPPDRSPGRLDNTSPTSEPLQAGIRTLTTTPFLEARLRIRVELLGQSLSGVGSYLHSATDETVRCRFELKMQIAGKVASFLQICDGRFLWQRDDLDKDPRLVRIDLRRLRDELSWDDESDTGESLAAKPLPPWLLLGGMSRLLRDLDDNYLFAPARTGKRGDVPITVLEGHWRSDRLQRLVPQLRNQPERAISLPTEKTPKVLPHFVRVTVGRDAQLPGFPYLVEFLRTEQTVWTSGDTSQIIHSKPIVTMEIYEVRVPRTLDESLFKYNPANQDVIDRTNELLETPGES